MRSFSLVAALALVPLLVAPAQATPPSVRFSTLYGGSGLDIPTAVTVDSSGASYVAGLNGSTDLPNVRHFGNGAESFVAKISPDGSSVVFSATIAGFEPRAMAVDASGQIYLTGFSMYAGLPLTNSFQAALAGKIDAVLVKLNAAADTVLFATYLGGSGDDAALGLALDPANGDIWVTGSTTSTNFPLAGSSFQTNASGNINAFLARFSNDGASLQYSTYFGAPGGTVARCIALDSLRRPVIAGRTAAPTLPRVGPFQNDLHGTTDAFVTKFSATGESLVFSTFLGGTGEESVSGIGLDSNDNVYVQGYTDSVDFPVLHPFQTVIGTERYIFVTQFSADGASLGYSTCLGSTLPNSITGWPNYYGDNSDPIDVGGIAVSPLGRVMVVGTTQGSDFPLVEPLQTRNRPYSDAVIATFLNPDGSLLASTYLGGYGNDEGYAAAAASDGSFFLTGTTTPGILLPDFPATVGAAQATPHQVSTDGFVMKMDFAAPPLPNDAFANAAILTGGEESVIAQTSGATKEAGEPNHGGEPGGKSIWYRWTAPASGRLILSISENSFPTVLALYHGSTLNNLQSIASGQSEVRTPVTAGETLYIAVDGIGGASGTLILSLSLSLPPNDDLADATLITGASASVIGSNVGSTGEASDVSARSVWWKWVAPVSGNFTLSTLGSSFDTWLLVYASGAQGLSFVTYNVRYTNNTSRLTFPAQAGAEYKFLVYGDEGQSGSIQLNLGPASPPPNDNFANRTVLTNRNEFVTGSDFDCVTDPEEQRLQALLQPGWSSGHIVWWEWIAPLDGAAQITTTNSSRTIAPGVYPNMSLIFFAGDSFPTNQTGATVGNYDSSSGAAAAIYATSVKAGAHYQIGLDSADYEQPVQFVLRIREIAPPRIVTGTGKIAAGKFSATAEGTEGSSYQVTASTDLNNWSLVSTHTNITGQFAFEAPISTQFKFFRVEEIAAGP